MNTVPETLKKNPQGLFKKESHYAWTMVLLVCCHVIYMTYLFPKEWADTPAALAFIDAVASVVPAIKNLQQHVSSYTNYWGMFYAIFWIMTPIYWILGFVGSFYLSPYRYQKFIVETSMGRVWAIFILVFLLTATLYFFPLFSFGIFINQMSTFLPKLILSWVSTAAGGYATAQVLMALIFKSNLNRKH